MISWNLCCHFRWQAIFLCFYCNIYKMKPDIFDISRTFSRYLEKKSGISGNIFGWFFVIFVSRLTTPLLSPRNNVWETSAEVRLSMGSVSDWSFRVGNLLQPIRGTTQIWVVTRHQCGISALVSQTSQGNEWRRRLINVGCFSHATLWCNGKSTTTVKIRYLETSINKKHILTIPRQPATKQVFPFCGGQNPLWR